MKISYQTCLISIIFCIELLKGSSANCHGKKLKYIYGDALRDGENCMGPDGFSYPRMHVQGEPSPILGRFVQDPSITRDQLLETYTRSKSGDFMTLSRTKRNANETSESKKEVCGASTPPRLCKSTFNTTAPMYGVSLTSGEAVTIVQKFPDLLQQVVYETCDSKECDLLHGECIQTYIPYLFLVIPLGPVTLTGQDYVLVESGCTCRPKYAMPGSDPNPTSVIPNFGQ
ncbi:unnamed protein product [Lepeophtheirus salmonis]|uniref:(salmon louse) hypothetical protein n=1 Tax=Lepeophtheirus salmonis TaxID=72036 RepID=A0A7R8H0J1_LEPSM|nr:unnamed protein product [Lepeophtheirus salmonis]CAF2790866.1 unnamed protein product [Lepeophtheirus salmonis]